MAVVLHYESGNYAKWRQKYLDLAKRHGDNLEIFSKVPFPFYRASLKMGMEILRAQQLTGAGSAQALEEVEARARLLWRKWKLQPSILPHVEPGQSCVLSGGYTVLSPLPF